MHGQRRMFTALTFLKPFGSLLRGLVPPVSPVPSCSSGSSAHTRSGGSLLLALLVLLVLWATHAVLHALMFVLVLVCRHVFHHLHRKMHSAVGSPVPGGRCGSCGLLLFLLLLHGLHGLIVASCWSNYLPNGWSVLTERLQGMLPRF